MSKFLLSAFFIACSLGAASTYAAAELILRDHDGSVLYLNGYDAMSACPKGTRLPTIRELAEKSQKLGSKGIAERDPVDPMKFPNGYDLMVTARNADGKEDPFYYSDEGYTQPAGDFGKLWFWSSSTFNTTPNWGFYMSGRNGHIGAASRDVSYNAVLCIH